MIFCCCFYCCCHAFVCFTSLFSRYLQRILKTISKNQSTNRPMTNLPLNISFALLSTPSKSIVKIGIPKRLWSLKSQPQFSRNPSKDHESQRPKIIKAPPHGLQVPRETQSTNRPIDQTPIPCFPSFIRVSL